MNYANPPWRWRSSWADGSIPVEQASGLPKKTSRRLVLRWKPNSPDQVLESDVSPQAVERRIENLQQARVAFFEGFLQRRNSQVRLAKARVNQAYIVRTNVPRLRELHHLPDNFQRPVSIPDPRISVA